MHLKRMELTNFRQFKKLCVDFSGNLIVVQGPNGSGKSNLIGAIQFALTGEQPGFTKGDLATWGKEEGSVRLFFEAGPQNEKFVITRKTSGDVTLKVDGETVNRQHMIEKVLREVAGLDKELVRQLVFVPQTGIGAILFDDPKNRVLAFQRLIGLEVLSNIYEALGREIADYDKPQGIEEAIVRLRQQLGEQQNLAKACRRVLRRYEEVSNGGTCPLCGAPATQDDISKHIGENLSRAQAELRSVIEKAVARTHQFIGDLEAKKEQVNKVNEKVDTLKRVREWFHFRAGPRIMLQSMMRELTMSVNSYLAQFRAPFVVDADEEGFGFRCRFSDGRTMSGPCPDASVLSGGQKVALAIAFRMAIYMCYGGDLGLLCLDEPTAYLDDVGIGHLGELFQKVRETARSKGLQILMATREKAIIPFFDTVIDLGALKEKGE